MQVKELTKAEEQVMQLLWQLKESIVKDILEEMPEPKPAYLSLIHIFPGNNNLVIGVASLDSILKTFFD